MFAFPVRGDANEQARCSHPVGADRRRFWRLCGGAAMVMVAPGGRHGNALRRRRGSALGAQQHRPGGDERDRCLAAATGKDGKDDAVRRDRRRVEIEFDMRFVRAPTSSRCSRSARRRSCLNPAERLGRHGEAWTRNSRSIVTAGSPLPRRRRDLTHVGVSRDPEIASRRSSSIRATATYRNAQCRAAVERRLSAARVPYVTDGGRNWRCSRAAT